jgi:hypothetical protein
MLTLGGSKHIESVPEVLRLLAVVDLMEDLFPSFLLTTASLWSLFRVFGCYRLSDDVSGPE